MNTNTLSTARLEARISTDLHATIKHVADMQNRTMTDFVITAIQEAVQRVVDQAGIIRLSVAGQVRFAEALIDPPKIKPALERAFAKHKQMVLEG